MADKDKYIKGSKQSRLTPGYYQIHVLLEESSNLCLKKNEDVDAMISVQAFGQISYSKILKKVSYESKMWGEHIYFAKTFSLDEIESLQRSLIIIKAWDHRKILKDALIGEHELSVSKIYEKQGHLMKNTWIALSNITRNFGQISGLVKVSINVCGQKDQAAVLKSQPYNASKKDKSIMVASGHQRKGHQLTVEVIQGCNLKPVAGQTTDAYIGVQFGMIYSRTETVVNDCNPKWNEIVQIPVHLTQTIATVEHIVLRLIDANVFKSKEVMGSCYISVKQLVEQKEQRSILNEKKKFINRFDQRIWVNFYGPQSQCQTNQYKHKYSIYPDIAPYYVGSVLMKVILQSNSNPRKDKRPRDEITEISADQEDQQENQEDENGEKKEKEEKEEKKVQLITKPKKFYKVTVKFLLGINLPIKHGSYQMSCRIGNFQGKSKMKKVKHGFAKWDNEVTFYPSFYENQEFPDVFFYLINEDEDRICYYRQKLTLQEDKELMEEVQNKKKETDNEFILKKQAKKYYKAQLQDKWRKLKPDLTKVKIYDQEAGIVKFKVQVKSVVQNTNKFNKKHKKGDKKIEQEDSYYGNQKEDSETEKMTESTLALMSTSCLIVIDLFCAQDLLAGDDDGSADPYFRFTFQESVKISSVKSSTVNPVYVERLILQGMMGDPKKKDFMPLIVTAFNKNPFEDQAIGTCYIDLEAEYKKGHIGFNTNYVNIPNWFKIQIDGNNYGKFLAGITVFDLNTKLRPKNQIIFFQDELQNFQVKLLVLGLRGLKSSNSIISIRKPIIYLDFDSLYTYSHKQKRWEAKKTAVQGKKEVRKSALEDTRKTEQPASNNEKIQSLEGGVSINIKKHVNRSIKLPRNKDLWPKLWGRVTNSVIGDLYQPHIGYFYIDLKQSYNRTIKMKQEFLFQQKKATQNKISQARVEQIRQKLKAIDPKILNNLTIFIVKNVKYNWHQACAETEAKLNKLKGKDGIKHLDQNFMIVMPSYVKQQGDIYKEKYKNLFQQNDQYIKIGYDNKDTLETKTKDQRNRHYRYCLDRTYEAYYQQLYKVKFGVFQSVPIKKGRTLLPQEKSLMTTFVQEEREVGFYKGNCLLFSQNQLYQKQQQQFMSHSQQMLQSYMEKQNMRMYLYILNAFGIPSKQAGALPKPYLIVKLGQGDEMNFYDQNNEQSSEPRLNVLIRKDLNFPQNSDIIIQLWDKGIIKAADQLIGQAVIHAQNRVFYQFGRMKFNNPAETHPLKVMQSRQQQGKIRFWVDFVPLDYLSLYKQLNISASPCPEYEVRVIVWNCCDIIEDEQDFTGMFDLYIACCFNNEIKDTDVHYRTQSGDGSFNWRMIFPVKLPITDTTLTFKIYDKSLVSSDEAKVTGEKDIREYLQQAYENQMGVKLFLGTEDMYSEARLPCEKKQDKTGTVINYNIFPVRMKNLKSQDSNVQVEGGKVYISVQILPKVLAEKKKAGEGRGEPNEHPNLPDPTGRFQFSLNPITMFSRLFGKKFKRKICYLLLFFLFITGFTYFMPSLAGSLLVAAI